MTHMPTVAPGDYVSWHSDTIHAVDSVHNGSEDSSVLYIPACPLTTRNASFLAEQRDTFLNGKPGPDYGGGVGETKHVGRLGRGHVAKIGGEDGLRSMGFAGFDGEGETVKEANRLLGF